MINYSTDHYTVSRVFWGGKKDEKDMVFINDNGTYNDEGIKLALDRAWADLTARTLERKSRDENLTEQLINNGFADLLKKWFDTDLSAFSDDIPRIRESYDQWHKKICKTVLEFLNRHYTDRDEGDKKVKYGKAQKVINMTMKGLYCMKGADRKESHFTPCHIALDSFTLEWFARSVIPFTKSPKILKGNMLAWSKLSDENKDGKYGYYEFVSWINGYFDNCKTNPYVDSGKNKLTPFQAEFYIWSEMQVHFGIEAFYFAYNANVLMKKMTSKDKKDFKNKNLADKIQIVRDEIDINA